MACSCFSLLSPCRGQQPVSDRFSSLQNANFAQIPTLASLRNSNAGIAIKTQTQMIQQGRLENLHLVSLSKQGRLEEAYEFIKEIEESNVLVDSYTYTCLLEACGKSKSLSVGRLFHERIRKAVGNYFGSLGNRVLQMYSQCDSLLDARKVFDEMPLTDSVTWATMISGYAGDGNLDRALSLFTGMLELGIMPNSSVYVSLIGSLLDPSLLELGRQLHARVVRSGLSTDASINTAMVNMYSKCACIVDAKLVFDNMDGRKAVAWTALMVGYTQAKKSMDVLRLFCEMLKEGVLLDEFVFSIVLKACSTQEAVFIGEQIHGWAVKIGFERDVSVGTPIVDLYVKCGRIESASRAFLRIPEPNDVSWSALIAGCSQAGRYREAISNFKIARSSDVLNSYMYTSIFQACSAIADLNFGAQIHGDAIKRGLVCYPHGESAMITMYSKCGRLDDAYRAFESINDPDTVAFTAIVSGCAYHGNAREALKLFNRMCNRGVRANAVTFIAVFTACSHSGLIREAKQYLDTMSTEYGVEPTIDHYDCMIDIYARAGKLEEALNLIEAMPFEPDAMSWKSLLGGCWMHKNLELGRTAAGKVLELDPEDTAAYILMFNMFTSLGRLDEAANVRKLMAERNLRKGVSCSWISVNGQVHRFVVGDRHHPRTDEIYSKLEEINFSCPEEDKSSRSTMLLTEEELCCDRIPERKEQLLDHSEKLAIAFGLISTSKNAPLLVFKNIRACRHCHDFAKHVSKTTGREIVVRDSNRFHHFKQGHCSCNDYW